MEVEDETPVQQEEARKREREEATQGGREDDEDELIPTEPAPAGGERRELTLADLMAEMTRQRTDITSAVNSGVAENRSNFTTLRADVGAARREAQEAKNMAAKATTLAHETQESVGELAKRVALLEKGGGPKPSAQNLSLGGDNHPKRDWDYLGGDDGDTVIIGGFRPLASREERTKEWEELKGGLPEDMAAQIVTTIIPASPGPIIILHLQKEASPKDTRVKMLDWTAKFKQLTLTKQGEGEATPRSMYAGPSKPFAMRQRNAKTMALLDGLKLAMGEERAANLRADLAKGRIIYDQRILAERKGEEPMPTPDMAVIQKILPELTEDALKDKVAEAIEIRDKKRKGT